jgi:ribonuclease HI
VDHEPLIVVGDAPPWAPEVSKVSIYPYLCKDVARSDPDEVRKAAAIETLAALPVPSVEVYTDGAAAEGVLKGGAGAIVLKNGVVHARLKKAAGAHCSSYQAELVALDHALDFLVHRSRFPIGNDLRVCTDSQSALKTLKAGPSNQDCQLGFRIWNSLRKLSDNGVNIVLQYVPSHCDLEWNEAVDAVAKEAMAEPQDGAPISFNAARALIKRTIANEWANSYHGSTYFQRNGAKVVALGDTLGLSRLESVELSRLRTGFTAAVRADRKTMRLDVDNTCEDCNEGVPEDLPHLFECPAKMASRMRCFGTPIISIEDALKNPIASVQYLRVLGRLGVRSRTHSPDRA